MRADGRMDCVLCSQMVVADPVDLALREKLFPSLDGSKSKTVVLDQAYGAERGVRACIALPSLLSRLSALVVFVVALVLVRARYCR